MFYVSENQGPRIAIIKIMIISISYTIHLVPVTKRRHDKNITFALTIGGGATVLLAWYTNANNVNYKELPEVIVHDEISW